MDGKVNSQGREQMHSLLDNCAESLRLMSYQNFMIFMRGKVHNIMAAIFILFYDFFKLNELLPSGTALVTAIILCISSLFWCD